MSTFFCDCLNITINTQDARQVEGKYIDKWKDIDDDDVELLDSFFIGLLWDVNLSISGVELAQNTLITERQCGDWIIHSCMNCGIETHSTHAVKGFDRVLVKNNLKNGIESLDAIKQSESYSKIFKIKLLENTPIKAGLTGIDQKQLFEATNRINNYVVKLIEKEEEAMSERIRLFKEKEAHRFLEFKLRASQEKEELLKKIRHYECHNTADNLFDTLNESYFGDPTVIESRESRDKSTDLPRIQKGGRPITIRAFENLDNTTSMAMSLQTRVSSPIKSRSFSSSHSNNKMSPRKTRSFSENSDDTLFDIDGFQNSKNCEPFYESDDDSSGDATSLESSGGYNINVSTSHLRPGDRVYATSVPVSIPLFENKAHSYDPESDEDDVKPSSPSHIAESIKALARSMQDSTSMFGELPRPRLNTNPQAYSSIR